MCVPLFFCGLSTGHDFMRPSKDRIIYAYSLNMWVNDKPRGENVPHAPGGSG